MISKGPGVSGEEAISHSLKDTFCNTNHLLPLLFNAQHFTEII